jgi:hypothetical protein
VGLPQSISPTTQPQTPGLLNEVTVDAPPPPIEWTDEQVSIWLRVNYKNPNAQVPLAVAKKLADKRFCKDHDSVFVDRPNRQERRRRARMFR